MRTISVEVRRTPGGWHGDVDGFSGVRHRDGEGSDAQGGRERDGEDEEDRKDGGGDG